MNFRLLMTLSVALIGFYSAPLAQASTIGAVGSPKVSEGTTAVEGRIGYSEADDASSQDERLRTRVHIDHGFTDYYAARLIASGDKRKDDSNEFDSLTFENRLYLLKASEAGFDFGLRGSYQYKDGDKKPDSINIGLYELFALGSWELRANQLFGVEVGEDSEDGVSAELRFQATYPAFENHRLGLESFHDFGNLDTQDGYEAQAHTIGPVLKGKLPANFSYETGYRAGISKEAPDHSVKFFLSRSF